MAKLTTLFVEKLSTIDFSYLHPEHGIVGESLIVDISLTGDLDNIGMIYDFGHIKKRIKLTIDDIADHKLLIPTQLKNIDIKQTPEQITIEGHYGDQCYFYHHSPEQAVALIETTTITPESITAHIQQALKVHLPDNVSELVIHLYPETNSGPYYHYSHGLKFHDGNCQRIAHGHRSKLLVYRNDQYDRAITSAWCDCWQAIYIASETDLSARYQRNYHDMMQFSYTSPQGDFQIDLPAKQVELVAFDSTVEYITRYIAEQIKQQYPNDKITVKNYEGVDKGALVTV